MTQGSKGMLTRGTAPPPLPLPRCISRFLRRYTLLPCPLAVSGHSCLCITTAGQAHFVHVQLLSIYLWLVWLRTHNRSKHASLSPSHSMERVLASAQAWSKSEPSLSGLGCGCRRCRYRSWGSRGRQGRASACQPRPPSVLCMLCRSSLHWPKSSRWAFLCACCAKFDNAGMHVAGQLCAVHAVQSLIALAQLCQTRGSDAVHAVPAFTAVTPGCQDELDTLHEPRQSQCSLHSTRPS